MRLSLFSRLFIVLIIGSCFFVRPSSASTEVLTIIVKPGDTLSSIAKEWDMPYEALAWHNRILNVDVLFPGDVIDIPANPLMPPWFNIWAYTSEYSPKLKASRRLIYSPHMVSMEAGTPIPR